METGTVCLLMAWHTGCCGGPAFSTHKMLERLPAVQCIHVLENPQGAVLSAQNSAVFQPLRRHETEPKKKVPAGVCATAQTQHRRTSPTRCTIE